MKTWLMPSLAYLDAKHLATAVLRTFRHIERNETALGHKAQSEVWVWQSEQRGIMCRMVQREWCVIVGKDSTWWPYSEDAVVRLYLRLRKRAADVLSDWASQLGETAWTDQSE